MERRHENVAQVSKVLEAPARFVADEDEQAAGKLRSVEVHRFVEEAGSYHRGVPFPGQRKNKGAGWKPTLCRRPWDIIGIIDGSGFLSLSKNFTRDARDIFGIIDVSGFLGSSTNFTRDVHGISLGL